MQKFVKTLRSVHAWGATGMTEDQVIAIAAAVYDEKCETMAYKYKIVDPSNCILFQAWLISRNCLKNMSRTTHVKNGDINAVIGWSLNYGFLDEVEIFESNASPPSAKRSERRRRRVE